MLAVDKMWYEGEMFFIIFGTKIPNKLESILSFFRLQLDFSVKLPTLLVLEYCIPNEKDIHELLHDKLYILKR